MKRQEQYESLKKIAEYMTETEVGMTEKFKTEMDAVLRQARYEAQKEKHPTLFK